jgi:hypothetical protein
VERAPPLLGHPVIIRLCVELREEIGPVRGRGRAGLAGSGRGFDAPGCPARNVHQHHRQAVTAECRRQARRPLHDLIEGMHSRDGQDSFLQVDHDERGLGVHR